MEILGLLDALESMILDGTKIPLTKKVLINEEAILGVIDKMRLVIQGGGKFAKEALVSKQRGESVEIVVEGEKLATDRPSLVDCRSAEETKAVEVLQQAYQMAKEIREGADKYADEILANLEATSTRILRTVKAGRERLKGEQPVAAGRQNEKE
ncbi:hypothetical protein COT42_03805 [Candidatus Saganbacteria bacterium CG08_land_8_20_14_0_20_45_16]|uniref:ATPase n=1 Tax=Candidatus Saganbacteria bacterium CG08_land_8_20_14_0_20_45_16 TaxID=2014293 RepID=A0A2H0XYA4_UNCSA|nr:MAG: hypothetical protein COT42_03805 [Candidatus Saganbacteria bacterium CG08_land_8_20_14_0_20_45_16]